MRKIEEYIEKVYSGFDESDEEAKTIKEETKAHLFEEVQELKKQGFTEDESINRAISNFGQDKFVIDEMNNILKKQHKLSKNAVCIIFILYIVGCIFRFINLPTSFINKDFYNETVLYNNKSHTEYVFTTIASKLENQNTIDESMKNEITSLLDEFNNQRDNGLYYLQIEKTGKIYYEYNKNVSSDATKNSNTISRSSQNWMVNYKRTDLQEKYDNESRQNTRIKRYDSIPARLSRISQYLFILSWFFLSFSYIMKAYTRNVISKTYISFFICTSVLIILFHFTGKIYSPYGNGVYYFYNQYMFLFVAIFMIVSKIYNKSYYKRLNLK